jgi:hypothetical protein
MCLPGRACGTLIWALIGAQFERLSQAKNALLVRVDVFQEPIEVLAAELFFQSQSLRDTEDKCMCYVC